MSRGAAQATVLRGRHILLTREEEGGGNLAALLRNAGALVRNVPFTETQPPADLAPLAAAASRLAEYDWVVLTSARAVKALAAQVPAAQRSALPSPAARVDPRILWACVGPATAETLRQQLGVEANLVPDRFDASTLAQAIVHLRSAPSRERGQASPSGRMRVLFPAAENARGELPARLRAAGMDVTQVTAYRSVPVLPPLREIFPPEGRAHWDAVVFTSGLVVQLFFEVLTGPVGVAAASMNCTASMDRAAAIDWLQANRPAAFGRSATEALEQAGVSGVIRAARPTAEDLARALIESVGSSAVNE